MANTEVISLKGKVPSKHGIEFLSIMIHNASPLAQVEWTKDGNRCEDFLRLKDNYFMGGDLIDMVLGQKITSEQRFFIAESAEVILTYVAKLCASEEYRKNRIIQLTANRAIHEQTIIDINHELNNLLNSGIANITLLSP